MRSSPRCSMNVRVACGRQRNPARSATAVMRSSPRLQGWRGRRFARGGGGVGAAAEAGGGLPRELGYSLQAVRKSREGAAHPDRNEQFEHINATAASFLRRKQPVISVDTKKKE